MRDLAKLICRKALFLREGNNKSWISCNAWILVQKWKEIPSTSDWSLDFGRNSDETQVRLIGRLS
jgi:hypothetical protein